MNKQNKRHRKVRKWLAGPNFSGQHLLHNKRIVKEMIEQARIKSVDTVLEIGAGKGALTFSLAEKAGKVLAVENDPLFVEVLQKKSLGYPNMMIVQRDFMKAKLPKEPFYVVANIPYAITTPIFEKLLGQPANSLQRAVLMIEKGAAKRFTADPITNPRILTWRMWFELKWVREVSRRYFSPPPSVDSAILRIRRRSHPSVPHHHQQQFMALAAYGLKYPQLPINEALKGIFTMPQMKHLVKNVGVERHTPIGSLTEHQWGVVFQTMMRHVEPFRWPKNTRNTKNNGR